jgi:hypothetical protein
MNEDTNGATGGGSLGCYSRALPEPSRIDKKGVAAWICAETRFLYEVTQLRNGLRAGAQRDADGFVIDASAENTAVFHPDGWQPS